MPRIVDRRTGVIRLLGLAATAALMLVAGPAHRAEALTLINPASSAAAKSATEGMITAVRHGGGGHGGGFHGGGFRGGGHIGGFHGGGFRAAHIGGYRYGGFHRHGGYRHYGGFYHRPHYGYRHVHRRYYYGGYYPYYHYPRRCRIIWTYYGPRRICHWHHRHRWGYRYW
jgi:hypothetical protein